MDKQECVSMHRIEALTDGIFAFAMTLLVLSINIPLSAHALAGKSVAQTLMAQSDLFINYVASFLLLAIFWVSHHRVFDHLKGVDSKVVWSNVLLLLFIALMPFAMELANEFPGDPASDFLFSLNLFIISTIYYLIWAYVTDHRRLVKPSLSNEHIKQTRQGLGLVVLISIFAMGLALLYQPYSQLVYIAIPVIMIWPRKKKCA